MLLPDKIKFAVLGLGHIGKRHADIIRSTEGCSLVAVADIALGTAAKIEDKAIPFFNSIDELLSSGIEFDVLSIATPNGLHEEHALKGIRSGHHVVIEKPMALTRAGCEHIIFEALHKQKQVFCVMQNRYSPPAVWLKGLIDEKVLGKIFMVQINCYWNRDDRYYKAGNWHGTRVLDGGVLFTQFSHFIDIMYWLFGDIENISSRITNFNHQQSTEFDDSGFVNFDIKKGGMGSINFSTSVWNENLESSITIIGENGTVKVGGQYMNEVEVCNIKDYTTPSLEPASPANDYGPYKGSAANHHFFFQNVVEVLHSKAPITTNALEGMKVVEIIERIYG